MELNLPPTPLTPLAASSSPAHARFLALSQCLQQRVIGQQMLVERLLIALLADGHLLVEGAPGLAKTTAIRALALHLQAGFARIQFTPDLLPADLTGSEIWRPNEGRFEFVPGPLFHPVVLADEINRAPAKVQSALLEAMAERQVSAGGRSWPLPAPFLVMATQNPIEQEGTYALPEAQLDRFLMHVRIGYPDADAELRILQQARSADNGPLQVDADACIDLDVLAQARAELAGVHLAPTLERYIVELVLASRDPGRYGPELSGRIAWGASPRGTIALERCARARAWLAGRDFMTPEDVRAVAADVLRHRILPSYQAQAAGIDGGELVQALLERVPVP